MRNRKGYTLLEMLLVISVISILTVSGILWYRNHQINQRLEKISLEMQNIAAAALNYKNDQGHWPIAHNTSDCNTEAPDTLGNFVLHYAPNQTLSTPFGEKEFYCYGNFEETNGIFWLALRIPANNYHLAERLAAQLPSAITTTDLSSIAPLPCGKNDTSKSACYVRLEVVGSIDSATKTQPQVASMGNCVPEKAEHSITSSPECKFDTLNQDGSVDYEVKFHCPPDLSGSLVASANFFDVGQTDPDLYPYALRTMNVYAQKNCPNHNGLVTCTLHIDSKRANGRSIAVGAGGHVGASYIAYCFKQTSTKNLINEN